MHNKGKSTIPVILALTCLTIIFAVNNRWITSQIKTSQKLMLSEIQQPATTNNASAKNTLSINERMEELEKDIAQISEQLDNLQTTMTQQSQLGSLPSISELEESYAQSIAAASSTASVSGPAKSELAVQEAQREEEFKSLEIAHAAEATNPQPKETHEIILNTFSEVIQQMSDADANINNVDCRQTSCRAEVKFKKLTEFNVMQMEMLLNLTPTLSNITVFPHPGENGKNKTVVFFSPPKEKG